MTLNVKFGFSTFHLFRQVLLNLFTFLMPQIKRYRTFWRCLALTVDDLIKTLCPQWLKIAIMAE